jgi:hypothetical protein
VLETAGDDGQRRTVTLRVGPLRTKVVRVLKLLPDALEELGDAEVQSEMPF